MHPTSVRHEAMRLLASGLSMNATSKELGVSRAAIRDWRDNGIETRSGGDRSDLLDREACVMRRTQASSTT
ncbi:MAG TPA: helix-turn-helix domain-containing protein [Nocardioidaceae bacterium]|nr:helix-turn-helix domain-containing protein [Nocardioidaceae bacterium]